jgi:hypothetical protein
MLVEGRAEHRRDGQDDMSIDHPLVEDLADLAHPVVYVDFGTTQAQRRFAAHRHQMLALSTLLAAVVDVPHLVRVPTAKHLIHQAIVVGGLIARVSLFELIPVIGKELFEDTPVPSGWCHRQGAPSWGDRIVVMKRFYHGLPASSTPHRSSSGQPSHHSFVLESWGLPGIGK